MEWQCLEIALKVNTTLGEIKASYQLNSKERIVQQANGIVLIIEESQVVS